MYQRPALGTCAKLLFGFGSLLSLGLGLLVKKQLTRKMESGKNDESKKNESIPTTESKANVIHTTESEIDIFPSPPIKHKILVGHNEFRNYVNELKLSKKITYFYFIGSKDKFGVSWCSDCNAAAPYVEAAWQQYKDDNSEFIMVDVGDRSAFKDKNSLFRLDREIHVTHIPTLLRWKTQRRLVTDQLLNKDLLEMLFSEFDD